MACALQCVGVPCLKPRYDSDDIAVYLDNKRAGTIISFEQGWTYVPAGHTVKDRGDVLPTPEAVMHTLEGEDQ